MDVSYLKSELMIVVYLKIDLIITQVNQRLEIEITNQIFFTSLFCHTKICSLKQIHIGDNDKMSPHDPLAYWEDHAACWRMQYRGSLGKK